jgi:hypothetical protein
MRKYVEKTENERIAVVTASASAGYFSAGRLRAPCNRESIRLDEGVRIND